MDQPATSPTEVEQPPSPEAKRSERWSLIRFILTLAVLAWALRCFIFAPFYIPSGSMLPTLYIGDYLAVAKWPYGYSRYSFLGQIPSFDGRIFSHLPKRGDVVVFHHPAEDADLIKRVIGLPGDVVEVRGGVLYLNGQPVKREKLPPVGVRVSPNSPCRGAPGVTPVIAVGEGGTQTCLYQAYRETLPGGPSYTTYDQLQNGPADDFPAVDVPQDSVFLMGDNRDDSMDSRFSPAEGGVGMLPVENIVGRATVTFWSTDGSASWVLPWTWFTALRGSRIGNGYTDKTK
jgi:signal peptidase I